MDSRAQLTGMSKVVFSGVLVLAVILIAEGIGILGLLQTVAPMAGLILIATLALLTTSPLKRVEENEE